MKITAPARGLVSELSEHRARIAAVLDAKDVRLSEVVGSDGFRIVPLAEGGALAFFDGCVRLSAAEVIAMFRPEPPVSEEVDHG